MAEDEMARVELFFYHPEVDIEPRYREFKVPYKGYTVLNALSYIYENLDSTFAFRRACSKGFCRCCVVSVNKKPVLACMEPAS